MSDENKQVIFYLKQECERQGVTYTPWMVRYFEYFLRKETPEGEEINACYCLRALDRAVEMKRPSHKESA